MALFRAASIKRKLTLLVMLTTTIALLVAAVQFILNDVRDYRRRSVADLNILARIVGENCISPLQFEDPKSAMQVLSALQAKPNILAAAVYKDDKLFARYLSKGEPIEALPALAPAEGQHFVKRRVVLCQTIAKGEEKLGKIYLDFDLVEVWRRVWQNCVLVAAMLGISALVAFFISRRLQREISKPILDLAQVANAISEKRDYSVRAVKQTEDELGFLIDCFNGMLGKIEEHEKTSREVNAQLAKSETRALAATEAKSQFLANMSHELRTPLNAIIGYSEMLQEEVKDIGQNQFAADLEKIHAAAKHQLALINDILDLSKIEAGKMSLFVESFDVAGAVQEIAATLGPLLIKNENQLEVHCPPELGTMRADQTKVRQILFNLLSNATKFTKRGVVQLEVRAVAGSESVPPSIIFRINDNGIGMSSEQLSRLFQPFSQAEAATSRKYGGTGLGLAISKKFCLMMGGELSVTSELGKGSIFTVRLPVEVAEAPGAARAGAVMASGAADTEAAASRHSPILVIDDEASARDLIQRALTKEGYRVETAASGPEGCARARQLKPAAITLDVMMPVMDGWAVLNVLKADPITADIPVVMLTVVDEKNLGFALGAADYLIKPIEWERLIAVLEKHRRRLSGSRLLVIEDDPDARGMLRRAAESRGWDVVEAENGKVGLQCIKDAAPGVILLDLMMPEMDGFTFLEELRGRSEYAGIPVIVVTAKDLTPEDRRRLNGNVTKIVQKGGHTTRELIAELDRVLRTASVLGQDI